ncbi:DUF3231 family protein [Bacillus sp. FJAT-49736]|uniref:DUF3231 family protein n=1 Tax=Bacillus sp. FJAT-49736 TaxID=2833582 RepID=UPI001BC9E281|nr:DUF3231 family protein [Bacillus sp. FJAT-49736]MBS4171838.1 DUF3231 family protein [Bacillus sp. FJAT-49736]
MNSSHNPKLTSAEIAALWSQYLNDSAAICFNKHILMHLQDPEIKAIFEQAVLLSQKHMEKIKEFFKAENFPIPIGFTENDTIADTKPLFSDNLSLHFINIMAIHGCHGYSGAVTTCSRKDVRDYFTECMISAMEICNRTKDVMLDKGLYQRPPALLPPDKVEFVQSDQFIAGWLGDIRPLSCIEITDIYFNLKKSILAKAVTIAYSQVIHSEKLRKFLLKAVETKDKHIKTFYEILNKDNLPVPSLLDAEVTDTNIAPFSDKLMMFHVGFLYSTAMIYYETGFATSPRRDLKPNYLSAIADNAQIGSEWLDLMIENRWLEQPPLAQDRDKLSKEKK